VRTALAFLIAACVLPRTAHAGRSIYGWLYGTEVLPERGVELQTWIWDENDKYGRRNRETWILWAPAVGVTDQLELSLPVELAWTDTRSMADPTVDVVSFMFRRFGIEARYRFASPDPVDASAFVPLIRLAVKRDVLNRDNVRLEGDAVVTYEAGAVQVVAEAGIVGDVNSTSQHFEARPGGGISVAATSELRLGAEVYSELSLDQGSESWASAGPNLSWTHGRFWLSGTFGVGLYHVRIASRMIWGIAF
jgi:hypothetical protein